MVRNRSATVLPSGPIPLVLERPRLIVSNAPMRSCLFARPRVLRSTCVLRATLAATAILLAGACGEGLPDVPIDLANHDRCETSMPPYVVDASASEIQCLVEEYTYITYAVEATGFTETGTNVPGPPACCEVCARKDTAADACKSMCKHQLCERAQDEHYVAGEDLGTCADLRCGFNFEACMNTNALHVQWIDLFNGGPAMVADVSYGLRTRCRADATDPARADGLFRYLEGLGAVPGAGGGLANVEDVVGYCQARGNDTDVELPSDSSGTGGSDPLPDPPPRPRSCGPYAEERFWVRPTNNFGAWNRDSTGVGLDSGTSYPVTVTDGGLAYTLLPCVGAVDAQCLRIDQLSVQLVHSGSGLAVSLGLLQPSDLIPMTTEGHIEVPLGALRFAVRYEQDEVETFALAKNDQAAHGRIDAQGGQLELIGLTTSSDDGTMVAALSLHADLRNTQPIPEIISRSATAWNRVSLRARTIDAELDPIEHQWTIPKVGSWTGDRIDVELPIGRHAVILRAEDVHRAWGMSAVWLDIAPRGT